MRALIFSTFVLGSIACGACSGGDPGPSIPAPGATSTDAPPSSPPAPVAPPSTPPGTPPATPPAAPVAPAGLSCLAKYYVGTAVDTTGKGTWALRLPDATELAWDDGKTKTYDEALETPDLNDTLSIPYKTGPIVPDNTLNLDPGRIRQDVLLKATFGNTEAAVNAKLVNVDFVGQTVKFHTLAAAALGKVSTKITALVAATPSLGAYVKGDLGGTFNWRPIANTTRMSAHSYGIAIDIVVAKSAYWEWDQTAGTFGWKNQIPQAIVDAFESEGFAWGGRWYHYDTMHFEYRPELFDATCKP